MQTEMSNRDISWGAKDSPTAST